MRALLEEMHGFGADSLPTRVTIPWRDNLPAPSESFEYPLPDGLGGVAPGVNQGGFIYVLEAVHRCLAAGLTVCPQYNQAESLRTLELVDAASLWKVARFLDPETMESEKQRYEEMEAKAKL